MPFDSIHAGSGYVELHKIMTGALAWFTENPARWCQGHTFQWGWHSGMPVTEACAYGGMLVAAGADLGRNRDALLDTPDGAFMRKHEPYLKAATGLRFRELAKGNDSAANFEEAMIFFRSLITKVENAIATGLPAPDLKAEVQFVSVGAFNSLLIDELMTTAIKLFPKSMELAHAN